MLQRIQSVYLLLVTAIVAFAMFLSLGYFSEDLGVTQMLFSSLGVNISATDFYATWGLFALLLISSVISLVTIFLYRKRPLQIRLSIFNSIVLIGYYGALVFFIYRLKKGLGAEFYMNWAICLPAVAFIFLILAIRAIGKDEVLVRAADRIR